MIEINLLPKELQWKRFSFALDKKLVVLLVIGAVVILGLAGYSFVLQAGKISGLEKNIANYKAESDQYAAEIAKIDDINMKKEQIMARMTAIELLDRNRDYWVNTLEDMIRRVPEYLWLTSVQEASAAATTRNQQGTAAKAPGKSTIEGFSFSLNALATFIVRLKKSEILSNVEITSITLEETEETKAYLFMLTCDFNAPKTESPSEGGVAVGSAGGQF